MARDLLLELLEPLAPELLRRAREHVVAPLAGDDLEDELVLGPRRRGQRVDLAAVEEDRALEVRARGVVVAEHGPDVAALAVAAVPVWNSTTGLGGPDQTREFSSSVTSKSIRLIFGRIDCPCRALEAQPKRLCQNIRIRSH